MLDPNAPAYPGFTRDKWPGYEETMLPEGGLTIRAEFAARAMQGMLAAAVEFKELQDTPHHIRPEARAKFAVRHADALIAELNKPTKGTP